MSEDRLAELLDQAVPALGPALDGDAVLALARRRQTRRRTAVVAGVLVVGAGVGSGFALGQGPGRSATLATQPSAIPTVSPTQQPVPPPSPTATATRTPLLNLVPVDPGGPAAGACEMPTAHVAIVLLHPDTPSPRCIQVRPGQLLRIVNSTNSFGQPGEVVTIRLRGFAPRTLQSGEGYTFPTPISDVLAPGYHRTSGGPHGDAELLVLG